MTVDEAKGIKLSKNFTLWELLYSPTALAYGYFYYQLQVTPEQIANLKALCVNVLQPLRDYLGTPIKINSGYRSEVLNKKIGGAKNSDHLQGKAADIVCSDMVGAFEFLKKRPSFRQLINEYGLQWIHISYDTNDNKNQTIIKT